MLKNSIYNVALFRVDNFPQHLNAVHLFFLFISNTNAVPSPNPYGTATHKKRPNLLIHFTPQSYYYPSPLPAPRSNPCRARSVLYIRYTLYIVRIYLHYYLHVEEATIFALHGAIRHYGRYISNAVISTSSGHRWSPAPTIYIYIYFYFYLCVDIYIIWTSRNGNFLRSPGVARAH